MSLKFVFTILKHSALIQWLAQDLIQQADTEKKNGLYLAKQLLEYWIENERHFINSPGK